MATLGTIVEYIYDLGIIDAPLTIGELPSSTTAGCGMVLVDGIDPLGYFGSSSMYRPLLRFLIRSSTYPEGMGWADVIKNVLHQYHDDVIKSCIMRGSILSLGKTTENLHEFQLTFSIILKE